MRILSYSDSSERTEQIYAFVKTFNSQTDPIVFEGTDGMNMFLDSFQKGDTVVLGSLNGVFTTVESFLMFLRFCNLQDIRIISIDEEIDSADEIFPLSGSQKLLDLLCNLKTAKRSSDDTHDDTELIKSYRQVRMAKRHITVINLYNAHYSIRDIMRITGYKSRKSIYLILQRYGIDVEFPSMQRGKTQDSHLHTGNDA